MSERIDPEHWPIRPTKAALDRAFERVSKEIERIVRNQQVIDDIKRRCGVSTEEK